MASAHVIKKGPGRFQVRYRLGGRESRLLSAGTFPSKKLAERRLALISAQIAQGQVPRTDLEAADRKALTLYAAIDQFLASRIDASRSSLKVHRKAQARLGTFGEKRVRDLSWRDIQAWVIALSNDLKPATVSKYLGTVRLALDVAECDPNPARSNLLRLPRAPRPEIQPPSFSQFLALRDAISPKYQLHIEVLEATGLRLAELFGVTWGDVDALDQRIRVARDRTKGGTSGRRMVGVPDILMMDIQDLCPREDRVLSGPVFPGSESGLRNAVARACKHAGIPHFSPHDLRHRFISLRIQAGWPPTLVAAAAGHSKTSVTLDIYSHVLTDEPLWLLERVSRDASVMPLGRRARPGNAEGPAYADPSTESGRYWARTSDPQLVELVLSQLS